MNKKEFLARAVAGRPIKLSDGKKEVEKFLKYRLRVRPIISSSGSSADEKDFIKDDDLSFVFDLSSITDFLKNFKDIDNVNGIRVYPGSKIKIDTTHKQGPTIILVGCSITQEVDGVTKIENKTFTLGGEEFIGLQYPHGIHKKSGGNDDEIDLKTDTETA